MIRKTYKLEVKDVREDGTFDGYASVFGNVDSDNEVVDKGAFRRTLSHSKGIVPILWQHDKNEPIGWNESAEEDEYGLLVRGKLDIERNDTARKAYGYLKLGIEMGGKPGLSIGFLVTKEGAYVKDGRRHFKEVALKEYSVVTFPSNSEAMVATVKEEDSLVAELKTRIDQLESAMKISENPVAIKAMCADEFAEFLRAKVSDDGKDLEMELIEKDGDGSPMSYDEALAAHTQQEEMENHRYRLEKARNTCMDGIMGCDMSKASKVALVSKAMHSYADHMTSYCAKAMDYEDEPEKAEDGTIIEIKSDNQLDIAKLGKKQKQARAHMKEGVALINAGHERLTKSYKVLQDIQRSYLFNDVNVRNPMGAGKSDDPVDATTKQTSDPDIDHSLTNDELGSLLGFLSVPTQGVVN